MVDLLVVTAAVAALAVLHVAADRFTFLDVIPRSRWLSLAGGVSVAYIFVRLLPELARGQDVVDRSLPPGLLAIEKHVYLIALAGLLIFYGLERAVRESQRRPGPRYGESTTSPGVYRLHIASFALYNVLIGYLVVHREVPGVLALALFTVAMGFHFLVTDFGLKEDHRGEYRRSGRWVLVGAILLGWAVGILIGLSEVLVVVLSSFLAGGVILNVLKEELPAERQSRLVPFFAGAIAYSLVLLAI
jgi:hypothetical protein